MEGPTNNSNSHTHTHSRPVRSATRYFYGNSSTPATFRGPVRRWEKKWVHVSSSQSSAPSKPRRNFLSNGPKSPNYSLLLCKWTPLSRPPPSSADADDGNSNSGQFSQRKCRYTPITVFDEKKQLAAKGVAGDDKSGETDQSVERQAMDSEDIYGLLDINNDLMGGRQETGEYDLIYTRRSNVNLGSHLENKNDQSGMHKRGLWATN